MPVFWHWINYDEQNVQTCKIPYNIVMKNGWVIEISFEKLNTTHK